MTHSGGKPHPVGDHGQRLEELIAERDKLKEQLQQTWDKFQDETLARSSQINAVHEALRSAVIPNRQHRKRIEDALYSPYNNVVDNMRAQAVRETAKRCVKICKGNHAFDSARDIFREFLSKEDGK